MVRNEPILAHLFCGYDCGYHGCILESTLQFRTELAVCSDNKNRMVKEFMKAAGRKLDLLRRPVQQKLDLTASA
ncbi:MAG TPA: hypothetical protein DGA22_00625 [Acidobacterium sp.]|nr:hypothetical protein [Acidobacterium sp.]